MSPSPALIRLVAQGVDYALAGIDSLGCMLVAYAPAADVDSLGCARHRTHPPALIHWVAYGVDYATGADFTWLHATLHKPPPLALIRLVAQSVDYAPADVDSPGYI